MDRCYGSMLWSMYGALRYIAVELFYDGQRACCSNPGRGTEVGRELRAAVGLTSTGRLCEGVEAVVDTLLLLPFLDDLLPPALLCTDGRLLAESGGADPCAHADDGDCVVGNFNDGGTSSGNDPTTPSDSVEGSTTGWRAMPMVRRGHRRSVSQGSSVSPLTASSSAKVPFSKSAADEINLPKIKAKALS